MLKHPILLSLIVVGPAAGLYVIARQLEAQVQAAAAARPRPPSPPAGPVHPLVRELEPPSPQQVAKLMATTRDSSDLAARLESVWELAMLRDDDGAILRFLHETAGLGEPFVAQAALDSLRLHVLTNPSASPQLNSILLSVAMKPIDGEVRRAALRWIDFDRLDAVLFPDFLGLLQDGDPDVRQATIEAVGAAMLRRDAALKVLANAYRAEPRSSLRREIIDRMAQLESPLTRSLLESLKGCWPEEDPYLEERFLSDEF